MNKIKEKKLETIKSQISEISNFAKTTIDNELKKTSINRINTLKDNQDDTITLTNIVDRGFKNENYLSNFNKLQNELDEIKKDLTNHGIILNAIMAKLS